MPPGPLRSLVGVQVVDLSDDLAGSYCTKLFADAGADVLKVEPPTGHPLRHWSRSGAVGRDGDPDGVLFRFLAAGQQSVVADVDDDAGRHRVLELLAGCDIMVSSTPAEQLEARGLGYGALHALNRELIVVSLTSFGLTGPRRSMTANDFLLQAMAGSLHNHGSWRGPPLAVGGGLGEWIAGAYGAAGALAARASLHRTGRGELVDVSTLEALAVTLMCYPSVAASMPGGVRRRSTVEMVPNIEPSKDGFVGLTTLTAQQWHDFAAMIERPDLLEDPKLNSARTRVAREAELRPAIHAWTQHHDTAEIVERAALFRVPAAPVLNGSSLPHFEVLCQGGLFAENPRGGFSHPRPPFRSTATEPHPVAPAPELGGHASLLRRSPPRSEQPNLPGDGGLPLDGVRVLDLTAFWAGPYATQYLATLGADVIKIESVQRPDSMRFNVSVSPQTPQWWEQGYLYLSANLNKRDITLNLSDDRGRELFLELAAQSDVVVENFTPRVMENFHLTYEKLCDVRPDIVLVSMPGWGREGPWRDRPGFATTMEQASGMAFVTGYADGSPMAPGLCDPLAGVHGAYAVLAALDERRRTGFGQHIDVPMIDLAVNVAVEQILEFEAYGELMTRGGNRSPQAAPQGVYQCAGDDQWLALSVTTEGQWNALCQAIDTLGWAARDLTTVAQRHAAHDRIDAAIAAWCSPLALDRALHALEGAGAQPVVPAYAIDEDTQMQARRFWESVVHPVVGEHRYPGWPMRLSGGPGRWYRSPAPLLGQHNEAVLGGLLGRKADEIDALRQANVIGERPLGL